MQVSCLFGSIASPPPPPFFLDFFFKLSIFAFLKGKGEGDEVVGRVGYLQKGTDELNMLVWMN